MLRETLNVLIIDEVKKFIDSLPEQERAKLAAAIASLINRNFETVHIKTLRNYLKELIIKKRRYIFCIENSTIYFLRAFTKKTAKTPPTEIKAATEIYKRLMK
ncbi:MAG: type II toxin-antitoxin system RelE/ParE family toxin [Candidatus Paceibacterota bacterium]|jgi:phage-related protein